MKNPILGMCQAGVHVLLVLKHGTLVAVNTSTLQIEYQKLQPELAKDDLAQMLTLNAEQVALGYKDGSVVLISSFKFEKDNVETQACKDNTMGVVDAESSDMMKLSVLKVTSSQLYSIEVCKLENSNQVELWCGCGNSFIEVFIPCDGSSQLQLKTVLNTHDSSADIPQDASIIQLKSSFNMAAHMMYALHSCGSVISCWSVCEQPVLNNVIKLTQLSSPGRKLVSN